MSYLALYRKYRPTNFDEVAGQNKIVKILKKSIEKSKISHAYLFYGPRGTGKTSIAKLIAKLINCESPIEGAPCNKCKSCVACLNKNNPDIIEMDAASNNGVDEIRKVIDTVNLMPNISKYKVYIIDEVHMLSTGAFNALLKTIEEPPAHVIFILATTEYYKVPETIISRCQCYAFERILTNDIIDKLKYICLKENIKISQEVLELIAKYCNGGLRDAIGMLDKLSSYSNDITAQDFYDLRGVVDESVIIKLVESLFINDVDLILKMIESLFMDGKNMTLFINDLLEYFTNEIVNDSKNQKYYDVIDILIDTLEKLKKNSNQKIIIEIGLLKIANSFTAEIISQEIVRSSNVEIDTKVIKKNNFEEKNVSIVDKKSYEQCKTPVKEKQEEIQKMSIKHGILKDQRINNALALANKDLLSNLKNFWSEISNYLYNKDFSTVASYLIDSTLRVAGDKDLIISVPYPSLLENMINNLGQLEWLFKLISGNLYHMVFILDEEWEKLRLEYVKNKKNGKIYNYIEEKITEDDIIISDSSTLEKQTDKVSSITEAMDLFGNDLVEIKD